MPSGGEVEELVRLPASTTLPTLTTAENHIPVLVTNGELRGDAAASIRAFAEQWHSDGAQLLQVIQKHELLNQFIRAHGNYLPTDLQDFRNFVELYVSNPWDRLPRKEFAEFLTKLVSASAATGRGKKTKRAIESMILIGSYVIEAYERVNNHIAVAEGWTIIASNIFQIVEREHLAASAYEQSLNLVWLGMSRSLQKLRTELLDRKHFVEPNLILGETDFIRGVRTLITLGWIASDSLIREQILIPDATNAEMLTVVKQILPTLAVTGEADWPAILCLSLWLEKGLGSRLSFCDYVPDLKSDWFAWRTREGDLRMTIAQQPASWSAWMKSTADISVQSVPAVLLKHPQWILPFVLTYPHRLNRSMTAVIDSIVGERVSLID